MEKYGLNWLNCDLFPKLGNVIDRRIELWEGQMEICPPLQKKKDYSEIAHYAYPDC